MASIVAHPVLVTHLRHLAAFWRELAVRDWETGADDADEAAYRRGVDACFVTCAQALEDVLDGKAVIDA
jgi:hypothetical protein